MCERDTEGERREREIERETERRRDGERGRDGEGRGGRGRGREERERESERPTSSDDVSIRQDDTTSSIHDKAGRVAVRCPTAIEAAHRVDANRDDSCSGVRAQSKVVTILREQAMSLRQTQLLSLPRPTHPTSYVPRPTFHSHPHIRARKYTRHPVLHAPGVIRLIT